MIPANAKPGDIILVHMANDTGKLIRVLQGLNGDGFSDYEHAAVYVGDGKLIEAGGKGAHLSYASEYANTFTMWSSGIIDPADVQRAAIVRAAYKYIGTPYSYLDYVALTARHFRIPVPRLKAYIASTNQMICSQLVARCYLDAGCPLYKTWTGYVTPGDIWQLLEAKLRVKARHDY